MFSGILSYIVAFIKEHPTLCSITLSKSISFFRNPESPSSCLEFPQSGLWPNKMQIASITVNTSSGGFWNTLISEMSLLSSASSAYITR